MIAADLITEEIPPILPAESCLKALSWMDEFKVSHIPVVNEGEYMGMVSDENILDLEEPDVPIKNILQILPRFYVTQDQHVFEVMRLISDTGLTVVPILNKDERYLGCTTLLHMMCVITKSISVSQQGAVLVLQMNQNDYVLSQIAKIVEDNDAKILSANITSSSDSTMIEVTLKINKEDLAPIIQTFNRYDYIVSAVFQESSYEEDMRMRYEAFMKYLNM